jgi:gliding motility-associated-like protein
MKWFLVSLFVFSCAVFSFAQQQFCFQNPSIEGTPGPGIVPAPWQACYGSPDTQPGQWGITQLPSNGNSYVSFLQSGWAANGYTEGMTQQVIPCLTAGQSYTFTVDLAHTNVYNTASPNGCYSSLAVYGGNSPCAQSEILWQSGAFYQTNWQTFTVTFTPSQNWCYLSFAPYYISTCGNTGFDYINVMMDNLSCIQPSGLAGGINPTCFGACNGSGYANPLGGTPPYTYLWQPGNLTTQNISNLCAGSYTVTVTDANNMTFADTITLTQPQQLQSNPQAVNSTCATGCNGLASVTPNGGTPPYTFSWSSGQTTQFIQNICAGTYTVTTTDLNGCSKTDTLTITAPPPITVTTSGAVTVCSGQPTTLTVNASGGNPGYTYAWLPGNGTNSSFTVSPTTTTTYTVIVTDANNCTSQQTVQVSLSTLTSVNAGNDVTICDYDSTHLNALAQTPNGVSYSWSPNTGLSCTTCANPWASPNTTTTYTVTATNGNCTFSDSITVNVASVQAAFNANPPTGGVPLNVVFTNNSVNGVTYQWSFGDGSPLDQSANPNHTYTNAGTYTVILITTNANGCVDTTSFTIVVDMPYSLIIPNVFTPNNDGLNDAFMPKFTGVSELTCNIYNRWGEIVYTWNTLNGYWNGITKNGGVAPDGTYYYVMILKAMDGTTHREKGYVELLRNK